MRVDETWHRLNDWSLGQAPSEHLAADVLGGFFGFERPQPSHPYGGQDGGADAFWLRDGLRWVMAVYFPRGQQSFADIRRKFSDDSAGVAANGAQAFVFVTNQELRLGERKELRERLDVPVEIVPLTSLRAVLDQPAGHELRERYLDIPAGTSAMSADAVLEQRQAASRERCAQRWRAAGLGTEQARELAEDPSFGAVPDALRPSASQPVAVWSAPMGAGKSITAERLHQEALAARRAHPDAPIPVLLGAEDVVPTLEAAVLEACAPVGDARTHGAAMIIDGLDQVSRASVAELVAAAQVLCASWPQSTAVLISRPTPALRDLEETRAWPPLTPEAQERCLRVAAGDAYHSYLPHGLVESVRHTLGRPLFALLTGSYVRRRDGLPRAPVDLLDLLGGVADEVSAEQAAQLRALAVLSVARELGPVPAAEVLGAERPDALIATGLVDLEPAGLRFNLPTHAQWYAARALMGAEVDVSELLEAPEDLDLWLYPLALAVSQSSHAGAMTLLGPLVAGRPGFASRVLEQAFATALLEGGSAPPWRTAGAQLREVLQALADGLGALAPHALDVGGDGRLRPTAVASGGDGVTVAFVQAERAPAELFALTPDTDAYRWRSAMIGPGAAWAWKWAISGVRQDLAQVIAERRLPVEPTGPQAHELMWVCAHMLLRRSPLTSDELDVDELVALMDGAVADMGAQGDMLVVRGPGGRPYHFGPVQRRLHALQQSGVSRLVAPVPCADRSPGQAGGLIGRLWSPERLVLAARVIHEQALVGYRQLVARWLPALADELTTQALMPAHVLIAVDGEANEMGVPVFTRAMGAAQGERDLVEAEAGRLADDRALALARAALDARPQASRWLAPTITDSVFDIGDAHVIDETLYGWLGDDLKRLGLIGTVSHVGSRSSRPVPWDGDMSTLPADG